MTGGRPRTAPRTCDGAAGSLYNILCGRRAGPHCTLAVGPSPSQPQAFPSPHPTARAPPPATQVGRPTPAPMGTACSTETPTPPHHTPPHHTTPPPPLQAWPHTGLTMLPASPFRVRARFAVCHSLCVTAVVLRFVVPPCCCCGLTGYRWYCGGIRPAHHTCPNAAFSWFDAQPACLFTRTLWDVLRAAPATYCRNL